MAKHPHAENMKLYAEDVEKTERPWELWERSDYTDENGQIVWIKTLYRRIPNPIVINNCEVPQPLRAITGDLDAKVFLWAVRLDLPDLVKPICSNLSNNRTLRNLTKKGLLHATKDAAVAHAEALLSFTKNQH